MQDNDKTFNFEKAMEEIESIVTAIEGGELGLDESIKQYERGCRLIRQCQTFLERKNQQLEEISTREAGQVQSTNEKSNPPEQEPDDAPL